MYLTVSLLILNAVLLFVIGYLLGERNAAKSLALATLKTSDIKSEAATVSLGVPRAPRNSPQLDQNQQRPGLARRVVSPSEVIARARQEKDGLINATPKVPPAVQDDFLRDAGAVVASAAD